MFSRYKVSKWTTTANEGEWIFDLELTREFKQLSWSRVAYHPTSEEVDDYMEYRRCREEYEHLILKSSPRLIDMQMQRMAIENRGNESGTGASPKGSRSRSARQPVSRPNSTEPMNSPTRGRRVERSDVPINEADREELSELKSFEFPPKKEGQLEKSRRMPDIFSAERL